MNKEDIKNLYDASDSIISWFLGEYMYHYKKEPIEFVDSLKKLNLPKYGAGTLYRWTWLKTEDMKKAKAAKTISIKSGKRSVQSWTDSLKSASTFAEEIGNEPDRRGWTHGIIEAVIPGSKILCFEHDLYDLYKQALKYAKKLYNTDRNDKMKTMFDQIYHTEQTLDDYLYQREWVVRLDNSLVKANDIHIKGWASLKAGTESPDHVIIVIDNPDTGESHIEFPDTNVVPFKRDENPLGLAASFKSKLLKSSNDVHPIKVKDYVMADFRVPEDIRNMVREEALRELHYPGGR